MKDESNLVWMDLEMTGLDPETDLILEIATVITDSQLNILAEGPVIAIHQPPEALENMHPWCVEHHGASGLTRRVEQSLTTVEQAERATLDFLKQWCSEKASPLCGNSIHQDRRFLAKHMPKLNAYLHYRIVDVSSFKEMIERWYPEEAARPQKQQSHLALDDIRESIAELADYRRRYMRPGS
ncbi:MAG: oligoribonuclease [Elusimicrobia bacterium]|nr:oligoribonuclease [Elusimicrobiota bacterium]